ncbi:helix-turn-helix domain-containing protein [Kribbella sp. NPDC051718]|uniref:helix-turn-helix domain-containing protein n=1 Tax=Kribbella sp. NPDC051718 TaxID=3155168 RepID=UPI003449D797
MQVHTVRDLGAAVREARSHQGLTQAELARRAGVSRDWLVRLEQGHPRLEVQLVLDVLAAAGLALATGPQPPETADQTEATWDELFSHLTGESDNG